MSSFQKAKIQSIESERVTLVFENGATAMLPIFVFEGMPEVGKEVRFRVAVLGAQDAGQTNLARELIREILSPNETTV